MSTDNGLDIMPVLPLARGVPVCVGAPDYSVPAHADPQRGVVVDTNPTGATIFIVSRGKWVWLPLDAVRVDLNDPQGFGYALRWLEGNCTHEISESLCGSILWNWMASATTDADRLALARALAEVTA